MGKMEQLELDVHRSEIIADMHNLVEKYRTIFGWDISEIDQDAADKLILAAIHRLGRYCRAIGRHAVLIVCSNSDFI